MARTLAAGMVAFLVVIFSLVPSPSAAAPTAADKAPGANAPVSALEPGANGIDVLNATLARWAQVIQPTQGQPARTFITGVPVTRGGAGAAYTGELAYQA